MLLEGFVKRIATLGDEKKYERCVNSFVMNAFGFFCNMNFHPPYCNELYRLGNALKKFGSVLKETNLQKKNFLRIPESELPSIKPVSVDNLLIRGKFLDFLT